MSGEEGETGLTIDPDQSHEFYRLNVQRQLDFPTDDD